jgi:signal transduction histidine kinase
MYVLVTLHDLEDVIEQAFGNIERHFQATLTNALSHERITPIHQIESFARMMSEKSLDVDRVKKLSSQIVAACEQIVLMTESQIVNYKVNCERYLVNAESKTLCFKSQFDDVLKSF